MKGSCKSRLARIPEPWFMKHVAVTCSPAKSSGFRKRIRLSGGVTEHTWQIETWIMQSNPIYKGKESHLIRSWVLSSDLFVQQKHGPQNIYQKWLTTKYLFAKLKWRTTKQLPTNKVMKFSEVVTIVKIVPPFYDLSIAWPTCMKHSQRPCGNWEAFILGTENKGNHNHYISFQFHV